MNGVVERPCFLDQCSESGSNHYCFIQNLARLREEAENNLANFFARLDELMSHVKKEACFDCAQRILPNIQIKIPDCGLRRYEEPFDAAVIVIEGKKPFVALIKNKCGNCEQCNKFYLSEFNELVATF